MRQEKLHLLFDMLLPITRCAGNAIMDIYKNKDLHTEHKQDTSPVTAADIAANKVLMKAIPPLIRNCPVVSEEDNESIVSNANKNRFWLIDPLDGTKEFINRNNEFTVNVALVEDGCVVLGVVYAPALNEMYWGGAKFGAYRQTKNNKLELIKVTEPHNRYRVIASKSHFNTETSTFISKLGDCDLMQAGSSLKFCRIAEGSADIYPRFTPTHEWDTAAAHAVIEGAGGAVLDINGAPLLYGKQNFLNPYFIACSNSNMLKHD